MAVAFVAWRALSRSPWRLANLRGLRGRGCLEPMESIVLGERDGWGERFPLLLSLPDRRSHLYAIGQTGVGKSTLLKSLILQDIRAGRGCALLDPHGDLADELLNYIPRGRTDDVVLFEPAHLPHPPAFNPLATVPPDDRPLVAAGVVSAMRHVWASSWGPRSEYLLYCAVAALLDHGARRGGATLLGLPRLFVDTVYRQRVAHDCLDLRVRSFWLDEFPSYPERLQAEAVAPLQNKVGMLLSVPALRNVLSQVHSTIKPAAIMDDHRIFIANLSKGRLGEQPSFLLGSLLLTSFALAALGRANVPEEQRTDFILYIDEFQSFAASESFAAVLSEARKYRFSLALFHQYLAQLPELTREAVLGNVGTLICFRVGEEDAAHLSRTFGYSTETLASLDRGEAVVRLLRCGRTSDPTMLYTRPPTIGQSGRRENVIAQSRMRYTRARAAVEGKIERWLR
jgi:hypothetical protein